MIWIEMSKDENHGGGEWGFTKCLWSPAYKLVNGKKQSSAYWEALLSVRADDIVLHLRGDNNPKFVGYSIAESDGFSTTLRPPNPGANWNYADTFYRVNLKEYESFNRPLELRELFEKKNNQLRYYFNVNKSRSKSDKKLLFYVIQNSDLRRQNGAYLSEVDKELYKILFESNKQAVKEERQVNTYVSTGERDSKIFLRKGQSDFSQNVRENFNHECCFPNCKVQDRNFLIGSHIARWSDHPEYRGETSNGLCLCLMHDKAFELGLFTLDKNLCISINDERLSKFHSPIYEILEANSQPIKESKVPINIEYVKHHWIRIGYQPK